MKLQDIVTQRVIRRLIHNVDYRVEILSLIDAEFLQYVIDFFKKIVAAKLKNEDITVDWYKAEFLNSNLSSDEIIINSGLNKKTISNSYGTANRPTVLKVTLEHHDHIHDVIQALIEQGQEVEVQLNIRFRGVSVDLNLSESLIVINSLAVKRAQIRGGAWSTAGKQVEKPLMKTLCHLFNVSSDYYELTGLTDEQREVDFFIVDAAKTKYTCEVKLMGKGNPESVDVTDFRQTSIFIADTLSERNRQQMNGRNIRWVELNSPQGYKKFLTILQQLGIPAKDFEGDVNERLDIIFQSIFEQP